MPDEVSVEEMKALADWWTDQADRLQQQTHDARTAAQKWADRARNGEAIRERNENVISDPPLVVPNSEFGRGL